jgi:hypothetical protein
LPRPDECCRDASTFVSFLIRSKRFVAITFNEVQVAAPTWASFYKFGQEPQLPAGTKVWVYVEDTVQNDPAEGPDVAIRFAGTPGESSGAHFLKDGLDLRIINPVGESVHHRYFASNADYSSPGVRVLRKADGTNFVVVPQSGAEFAAGEYRFRFKYLKKFSDLPVLSQAGDQSPEIARLDIPWETSNN